MCVDPREFFFSFYSPSLLPLHSYARYRSVRACSPHPWPLSSIFVAPGQVKDNDKSTLQRDANDGEDAVGWILKRGGAGNMVWQRRWVVLTGCRMTYYKDKEASIRPQGTIWLVGVKVLPRTDSGGATSIALVPLPGGQQKERLLCGETVRMNDLWLEAIKQAHAGAAAKGSRQGFLWVKLGGSKSAKQQVWRRRWAVLDGCEETLFTFSGPDESDHQEEYIVTGSRLQSVSRKAVQLGSLRARRTIE